MKIFRLTGIVILMAILVVACSDQPSERDMSVGSILDDVVAAVDDSTKIIVSTVGPSGVPHIMVADGLVKSGLNSISVSGDGCPVTATKLTAQDQTTPRSVSVVLWNEDGDTGYQMIGNLAIESSGAGPNPQVSTELVMEVQLNSIVAFSMKAHDDVELN